jgi:hypothetical protein
MKMRSPNILAAVLLLLTGATAEALETDQFYAWGKPIDDSTAHLNAWVRVQIQDALDAKVDTPPQDCESAVDLVQRHLQFSIYQPIEIWINSTQLIDRIPRGAEETRDYYDSYLLSKTVPFDFARWLHPSPTLEVNAIRIGADKLAHFFSEGLWYYNWWKKNRDEFSEEAWQREMLVYGVRLERWVQGELLTGIISPADMEANYQGFIFYRSLCHGDQPLLYREQGRWQFFASFDLGQYVSPAWDESWNPNIHSARRWPNIRETMRGYCPLLQSSWVKEQRARYAELDPAGPDGQTPLDKLVAEMVAGGELPDPRQFDITTVCSEPD